ncbi:MAG: OadG family protein [Clostridia bacterium]|nr:OadG family protein [Clostridia bacterium]
MLLSMITDYSLGEFALFSVIGLLIVVLALAVLVLIITGISKILGLKIFSGEAKNEKNPAETTQPATAAGSDAELVAAITAALYAYYEVSEEETAPVPFVIRSIRKN